MRLFFYRTGQEVRPGDSVVFFEQPGVVRFLITEPTGDEGKDWYLHQYPQGGVMIEARGWGLVFLNESGEHEHLDLVGRG